MMMSIITWRLKEDTNNPTKITGKIINKKFSNLKLKWQFNYCFTLQLSQDFS